MRCLRNFYVIDYTKLKKILILSFKISCHCFVVPPRNDSVGLREREKKQVDFLSLTNRNDSVGLRESREMPDCFVPRNDMC